MEEGDVLGETNLDGGSQLFVSGVWTDSRLVEGGCDTLGGEKKQGHMK